MVALKEGQWGKTGIDVFDWHQMHRVSPEGYMVAHMLGSASRVERRKMYFCMMKQALWGGNDDLAVFAFEKCLLFIQRKKETLREKDYWEKGQYPTLWSNEKEVEMTALQHRLLRFCRATLQDRHLYKEVPPEERYARRIISINLSKTWKAVVHMAVEMLHHYTRTSFSWSLPIDDKLVGYAFDLVCSVYEDSTTKKAFKIAPGSTNYRLPSPGKEVLEMLKNTVNLMDFKQVLYFLEKHPDMPSEFLHIFRMEYVRKGGALALQAPPIKK